MSGQSITKHRLSIHGVGVEIDSQLRSMDAEIVRALGTFSEPMLPEGFMPVEGSVRVYQQVDVVKHLSPNAQPFLSSDRSLELYQDGERFWLIDDRWGMVEMNMLKNQWRAWVLPEAVIEPHDVAERAVIWPMAQLLRARGICMLPAASLSRAGTGLLLISPIDLEPELSAMARAGFRIVGQRWTALREEDGRIAMMHLPGRVLRTPPRTFRPTATIVAPQWVNLEEELIGVSLNQAFCTTVVIVESARRPVGQLKLLKETAGQIALRHGWPIIELHPSRRQGQLASKLAQRCEVYQARLSRRPLELLASLERGRRIAA